MSKYGWDFTLPESFLKTQEMLNKVSASALAMSDAWKTAVLHYDYGGAYAALNAYLDGYESISRQLDQMTSVAKTVLPLIDTSAYANLLDALAIKTAFTSIDWSWLSEVYTEDADDTEIPAEEKVAPEIRAQFAADITEVLAEPKNMHITSRNKYLQWLKESPEHALQFLNTLLTIITTIIAAISLSVTIQQARTVKDSHVYEEPASTSTVVYNLTVENNVTVIGDAPYYYEVEFVNSETGESMTGYIYKANLAEVVPDTTENAGESETVPETTESQPEHTE